MSIFTKHEKRKKISEERNYSETQMPQELHSERSNIDNINFNADRLRNGKEFAGERSFDRKTWGLRKKFQI